MQRLANCPQSALSNLVTKSKRGNMHFVQFDEFDKILIFIRVLICREGTKIEFFVNLHCHFDAIILLSLKKIIFIAVLYRKSQREL